MAPIHVPATLKTNVPLPNTNMVVDLSVVPTYKFKVRLWLGMWLLRVGLMVLGANAEFKGIDDA